MAEMMGTSLRRGVSVLVALASDEAQAARGLGVTRIAERTDYDKSQISRTLKTLAELGLVDRDRSTLAYRLGWQLFSLASHAGDQPLLQAAGPLLDRLTGRLGEGAHLSVLQGTEVLTVLSRRSARAVQAIGWVGRTVPAYCTSSGRALLMDHGRDDLEALWPEAKLPPVGPRSPTDIGDLHGRIEAARRRGFSAVDEELEPGLVAVAAPVRDQRGRIVAAIDVSAPKFRLGHGLEEAGRNVKVVADELTRSVDRSAGSADGAAQAGY